MAMRRVNAARAPALLLLCLGAAPAARAASCGATIVSADFNGGSGSWSEAEATSELQNGDMRVSGGWERSHLTGSTLRVDSPEGKIGWHDSGMRFDWQFAAPMEEATLSYKIRFSPDYDWTYGGKIPGLCPDDCLGGCESASSSRGWSSRMMWHQGGALVSYAYYPGMSGGGGDCGNFQETGFSFQADTWYTLKMVVKVGTPGSDNGALKIYVDGRKVLDSKMAWTQSDGNLIEKLTFQQYHGGSKTSKFAPSKDQYIEYDDLKVQEGDCGGGSDSTPDPVASSERSSSLTTASARATEEEDPEPEVVEEEDSSSTPSWLLKADDPPPQPEPKSDPPPPPPPPSEPSPTSSSGRERREEDRTRREEDRTRDPRGSR